MLSLYKMIQMIFNPTFADCFHTCLLFINHAAKCNVTTYKTVLSECAKKKASCHYTYYVSSVEVHNRWNHQFHMLWKRICTTLNKVLNLLRTEFSNSDQLVYTLGLDMDYRARGSWIGNACTALFLMYGMSACLWCKASYMQHQKFSSAEQSINRCTLALYASAAELWYWRGTK